MDHKTDTDRGRKALEAYLKDCDDHAIVPDVGGAFHFAFMAGRASLAASAGSDGVASLSAAEPVAEVVECSVMGQQTLREIDGRWKFLRIGDKLYTRPFTPSPQAAPAAGAVAGLDLHPRTADLIQRFMAALAEKLARAEKKYGYSDGWASPDCVDGCQAALREHLRKGDPRDVAAYCAFLWHHGAVTTMPWERPAYGLTPSPQAAQQAPAAMKERPIASASVKAAAHVATQFQEVRWQCGQQASGFSAQQAPAVDESKAITALRYYRDECSGAEPSISVFHRMLDEALAAPAAPSTPASGGWMPIETAPRDGASFLGHWSGGEYDCSIRAVKFHNGKWWEPNEDYLVREPTHWMPLPASPTIEGESNV